MSRSCTWTRDTHLVAMDGLFLLWQSGCGCSLARKSVRCYDKITCHDFFRRWSNTVLVGIIVNLNANINLSPVTSCNICQVAFEDVPVEYERVERELENFPSGTDNSYLTALVIRRIRGNVQHVEIFHSGK